MRIEAMLQRIQGEFMEMPGLRLTANQAQRLWGLEAATCHALLGALVDARFLTRSPDGWFMRVDVDRPAAARPTGARACA
jgi:DNA-binding IclR family transcriptional regulator